MAPKKRRRPLLQQSQSQKAEGETQNANYRTVFVSQHASPETEERGEGQFVRQCQRDCNSLCWTRSSPATLQLIRPCEFVIEGPEPADRLTARVGQNRWFLVVVGIVTIWLTRNLLVDFRAATFLQLTCCQLSLSSEFPPLPEINGLTDSTDCLSDWASLALVRGLHLFCISQRPSRNRRNVRTAVPCTLVKRRSESAAALVRGGGAPL